MPAPAIDEPRGADLVRAKSSDELTPALDPATIAQLASWFGLPSYTELEERAAAAPEENADDKYWREIREKVAAAVEPAMIERVASKVTSADRLLQVHELAPMTTEVPVLLHDERFSDQVGMASEPRVLELSHEHLGDLNECAPQAILRDLYRPEADFCEPCTWREPWGTAPPDDLIEVREIMKLRFPMPPWIKPVAEYLEAVADMRAWKAKDWGALPIPRPEGD
ncbi:MAG: hypothetical protein K8W52_00855 [Deltaproteobacteria bacterium]|nr:hypothetical protein [Deltaproteobacteria bacterium]